MSGAGSANGSLVIARAAEVLRLLHDHPQGLTQTEIGERLGLTRSTTGRTLTALRAEGLVAPADGRGPFRIGAEVGRLAASLRTAALLDLHPFVEELSHQLDETVELYTLDRDEVTLVDQVTASRRLRVGGIVGEKVPLHCTAAGKAALSALAPAERANRLPRRLGRFTPATVVDRQALLDELAGADPDCVQYEREEHVEGVCAVAVVLDSRHDVMVATIAVEGSLNRVIATSGVPPSAWIPSTRGTGTPSRPARSGSGLPG